jgi:2-haloalkanoic acid dehalogenase type II
MAERARFDAVVFDLLTALIDSWSLWDAVAGGPDEGRRWRLAYLDIAYAAGDYRPYELLVMEACDRVGMSADRAQELLDRWDELQPWPGATDVLTRLRQMVPLAVVTNCSEALGARAVARTGAAFDVVVTAERAGAYKPRPEPYRSALSELGTDPARTLFVAGSPGDVGGAGGVGMPVFWHNHVGIELPAGAAQPWRQAPTLEPLPALLVPS